MDGGNLENSGEGVKKHNAIALVIISAVVSALLVAAIMQGEYVRIERRDRERMDEIEERIDRLETRMAGQAAASDYFHQEIDKLKGD